MSTDHSRVPKLLQAALELREMTLAQFAARVGVPSSTAHGWVHGTHGIKPKWFRAIAEALELDVAELVA